MESIAELCCEALNVNSRKKSHIISTCVCTKACNPSNDRNLHFSAARRNRVKSPWTASSVYQQHSIMSTDCPQFSLSVACDICWQLEAIAFFKYFPPLLPLMWTLINDNALATSMEKGVRCHGLRPPTERLSIEGRTVAPNLSPFMNSLIFTQYWMSNIYIQIRH